MSNCLIKNSEYRTKLALSGIPEISFYAFANSFVNEYGRFPNLDEIPGSDSTEYLKDTLHVKNDSVQISDILSTTGTESLDEAIIKLNDKHTDLEIDILPMNKEALLYSKLRPSEYNVTEDSIPEVDSNPNLGVVFTELFDKLRRLYGINLIPITNKSLASSKWKDIAEVLTAAAFVYNGEIYINTDLADADAPIHEMSHILLGSIRFKNPDLYQLLISMATQFKAFAEISSINPNKTLSDKLEETFVQEVSKYLAGMPSDIDNLDTNIKYELHYNIKRLLDSSLMGNKSVKSIADNKLYNLSLKELSSLVQSRLLEPGTLSDLDDAALHRMLSNTKSNLMKKGDLREEC